MIKNRVSIGVLFFLCGLNFASWATRIPDFKDSLQLSDSNLGGLLMGLPIGSMVSLPLAGWLLTKYKSKTICIIAIGLYILIMPLLGLITSSYQLFIGLFAFGMAGDLLNIAMNTQVVSIEEKLSKTIMSSFHAIFSLGLMLGAIFGGYISKIPINAYCHFVIISIMNLICILIFQNKLLLDEPQKKAIDSNSANNNSIFNLNGFLVILSFIAFCGMLCEGAMADWITIYFRETVQNSHLPNSIGFSSFAFAMVIGRLLGDLISNKYGIEKVLFFSGLFIALGMSITLVVNQLYPMIIGCFVTGIGIATIVPLIYSAAGKSKDIPPSVALAGVSTISYVGFLFGPVIIGYLSDIFTLKYALQLLIALGILASIISKLSLSKIEK
jgi:predicted MFS family arabinose efflux permease